MSVLPLNELGVEIFAGSLYATVDSPDCCFLAPNNTEQLGGGNLPNPLQRISCVLLTGISSVAV
jgi:hypothetical protein